MNTYVAGILIHTEEHLLSYCQLIMFMPTFISSVSFLAMDYVII